MATRRLPHRPSAVQHRAATDKANRLVGAGHRVAVLERRGCTDALRVVLLSNRAEASIRLAQQRAALAYDTTRCAKPGSAVPDAKDHLHVKKRNPAAKRRWLVYAALPWER